MIDITEDGVGMLSSHFTSLIDAWGDLHNERFVPVNIKDLPSWQKHKKLLRNEAVDVSDDITDWLITGNKGFIRYGHPFIIYPYRVGGNKTQKYHITKCTSLLNQIDDEKEFGSRYKAWRIQSSETRFVVELWRKPGTKKQEYKDITTRKFSPCINCLTELGILPQERPWNTLKRRRGTEAFSLQQYYNLPPHPEVVTDPEPASISDAVVSESSNDGYSPGKKDFFRAIKRYNKFQCSECQVDLSNRNEWSYLTIHHKDRKKHNDAIANLQVLCIRCHGRHPRHEKLRESDDYKDFVREYGE